MILATISGARLVVRSRNIVFDTPIRFSTP